VKKNQIKNKKSMKKKKSNMGASPTPEEIYNNTNGPLIPASDENGVNRTVLIPDKLIEKVKKKI
jgi:hypothetical protein